MANSRKVNMLSHLGWALGDALAKSQPDKNYLSSLYEFFNGMCQQKINNEVYDMAQGNSSLYLKMGDMFNDQEY